MLLAGPNLPQHRGSLDLTVARTGKCLLVLILLISLAPAAFAQGSVTIEGKIRSASGDLLTTGVSVRLETVEGEPVASVPVNSDGRYIIVGVNKLAYVLIVTAPGYEPYQAQVNAQYGRNDYIQDVTLQPAYQVRRGSSPSPSRTDSLAPHAASKEYEKGEQALERKDLKGARTHFEKAIAAYPCYARAQTEYATVEILQHHTEQADSALKKARECDPDFPDAYLEQGALMNVQKRYSESIAVLQEGVRRAPTAWEFYYQLGVAQAGLEQYAAAEQNFSKAYSFNPHPPPDFHVKLADVYLKEKSFDKAYEEMGKYLQDEPNGRFAPRIKQIRAQMESSGVLHAAAASTKTPQ